MVAVERRRAAVSRFRRSRLGHLYGAPRHVSSATGSAKKRNGRSRTKDLVRRFVEACRRTRTILPARTTIERLCADALLVDGERAWDWGAGLAPELGFGIAHWSACRRVYVAPQVRIGAFPNVLLSLVVGFTGGGP